MAGLHGERTGRCEDTGLPLAGRDVVQSGGRSGGRKGIGGPRSSGSVSTVTVVAVAEVLEVVAVSKGHDIAFETRDYSSSEL